MYASVKRPAPVSVIPAAMRRRGPHALAGLPAIRDVKKKVIDSGSSAMPARTAGSPRTSCRNSGNTNNSPYMPKVISVVNIGTVVGTYTTPALHVEVSGMLTNTHCTSPYRGAGRPEASYMIERLIDIAADQIDLDPAELRRRNTIPPQAMPYRTPLT